MENPYAAPKVEVAQALSGDGSARHLPKWIRFFSWVFLVIGPLMLVGSIIDTALGTGSMTYDFYGVSAVGSLENPFVVYIVGLFTLNSIAAYGLLWKKRWGLDIGLLAGGLGLLTAAGSLITFYSGAKSGFNVRLEPIFLIAFIVSLLRRRKAWLGERG